MWAVWLGVFIGACLAVGFVSAWALERREGRR